MPKVPRRTVAPIRYRVSMPEPVSHELHVAMEVPALAERATVDVLMAAWAPGSYLVRDFSRNVYDLTVEDSAGRPVVVERLDKLRWRVASEGCAVTVRYRVFAFEQSVRTSFLDDAHAFWNGTSVFFHIEGELGRPCEVVVDAPEGWRVSTALPAAAPGGRSFRAAGYDELADSPFEVGTHTLRRFRVRGTRFEVALYGRTNADVSRLIRELERIVASTARIFGGFPFDRYLFIVHALPARGGGLEHARSTTLDIAGLSFDDEKGYQAFAELAAHEFFHAWNVKRIHDRVLGPFDYTRECYTRLLWFHEGFTEYMESIVLLRAGLLAPERYLAGLAEDWGRYVSRPGRHAPLSELSFEAWIKQYKPSDNHTNRMVSYYEKGKWAALVLEILTREATRGRRGVEDLFLALWESHGVGDRGITSDDVRAAAEAVAGRSLGTYFSRYIDGSDELPVPGLLRRAGIAVTAKAPWEGEGDPVRARRTRGWAGLQLAGGANDRATVKNVVPGSPAWRAGLTYGDELVAVDGMRATAGTGAKRFADRQPGDSVPVTFFRQDGLRTVTLVMGQNPERRYAFDIDRRAAAGARAIRRGWLGG